MRSATTFVTLVIVAAGCAAPVPKWKLQPAPVGQVIEQQSPDQVRMTLSNGDRFEVRGPVVVRDTLAGLALRGVPRQPQSFAVPIDSVAAVEVLSGFERTRRSMLPFVLALLPVAFAGLMTLSSGW